MDWLAYVMGAIVFIAIIYFFMKRSERINKLGIESNDRLVESNDRLANAINNLADILKNK